MPELNEKTVESIVRLARTGMGPQSPTNSNIEYAVVPDNHHIESLEAYKYNSHAATPERIKADVKVLDPESFIEYYALFSDPNSRVFANEPTISIVGVLDYHASGDGNSPRWGQHRLSLAMQPSEEWKTWTGHNNKHVTQMAFAEFLEQNAIDIITPSPASILEVARDLEATTEVQFGSGSRTQDGQVRFRYSEEIKATIGGGTLAVPERFTVSIPVFVGGPRISMDALLRFRVKEGKLELWFTLMRPEEVRRTAFLQARKLIADILHVIVINGSPS